MRGNIKNRQRAGLPVESLEGKTLLSAGLVSHHAEHPAVTAAVVAQAAQFSGTLTGVYSNVHIPFAGYLLSYWTSGTLSGVGFYESARLDIRAAQCALRTVRRPVIHAQQRRLDARPGLTNGHSGHVLSTRSFAGSEMTLLTKAVSAP